MVWFSSGFSVDVYFFQFRKLWNEIFLSDSLCIDYLKLERQQYDIQTSHAELDVRGKWTPCEYGPYHFAFREFHKLSFLCVINKKTLQNARNRNILTMIFLSKQINTTVKLKQAELLSKLGKNKLDRNKLKLIESVVSCLPTNIKSEPL